MYGGRDFIQMIWKRRGYTMERVRSTWRPLFCQYVLLLCINAWACRLPIQSRARRVWIRKKNERRASWVAETSRHLKAWLERRIACVVHCSIIRHPPFPLRKLFSCSSHTNQEKYLPDYWKHRQSLESSSSFLECQLLQGKRVVFPKSLWIQNQRVRTNRSLHRSNAARNSKVECLNKRVSSVRISYISIDCNLSAAGPHYSREPRPQANAGVMNDESPTCSVSSSDWEHSK